VAETGFVRYHEGTEVNVVIVEEIVQYVLVECGFGRGDFGPLHFESGAKAVEPLFFTKADRDFAGFVEWAPNSAQDHDLLPVVRQMAAFVAVDVIDLAHVCDYQTAFPGLS
jgi:hypothetical protein